MMISSPTSATIEKREMDGLGAAVRDEDVVRLEGDAVVPEIAGHGLAELEEALGRAVAEDRVAVLVEGVDDRLGRRDVGVRLLLAHSAASESYRKM